MIFWAIIAVVTFATWKLSHGRKVITIGAALACFAVLYAAGYPAGASATSTGGAASVSHSATK